MTRTMTAPPRSKASKAEPQWILKELLILSRLLRPRTGALRRSLRNAIF